MALPRATPTHSASFWAVPLLLLLVAGSVLTKTYDVSTASRSCCLHHQLHLLCCLLFSYEDAHAQLDGANFDWYFCRGYFLQASNSFQYYTNAELGEYYRLQSIPTLVRLARRTAYECNV